MTPTETTTYWTARAEACFAAAAELKQQRGPAARRVREAYSHAAGAWRRAAERAESDDPISRDMVDGHAQDGAKREARAHQLRHEFDGTPIPPEATAYPEPADDEPMPTRVRRMQSAEVRSDWRNTLDHVRAGGEVVVELYRKPVARIIGADVDPADIEPRELDIDPATITLREGDAREQYDEDDGLVWCRMSIGDTPDGTPVIVLEERLTERGERDPDAPLHVVAVWAFDLLSVARYQRDMRITDGWSLPSGSLIVRDSTA
ncbi:hypothetical protein BJF79_30750 [Actinomadura sp. CNU-125]|uniref:hypothetical protein n=1 Tax=Actinomadura sp. CNU-125 TaxID=1904961 RepID=UPI000962C026|nr:hypothetical protein [Actinomadura sp. CNU-125]OLT36752.1 hypothetical protein BJF79_30750 [Actinomadura sp. CNU-125]